MFARLYVLSTFALLAVATPWGAPTVTVTETSPAPTTVSECNTGSVDCCNQVVDSSSEQGLGILNLLNLLGLGEVLEGVTGSFGLDCSPITGQGIGDGSACAASPVCCSNSDVGGLFSIGCQPITL